MPFWPYLVQADIRYSLLIVVIFLKAVFPSSPHRQLPAALNRVLGDIVNVTPNDLFMCRKATGKRKYDTVRKATERAPARPLIVHTVETIVP